MAIPDSKIKDVIAAINECEVETVRTLVKEGIDLDLGIWGTKNRPPLLVAVTIRSNEKDNQKKEKLTEIITILLDAKANINHMNDWGDTPLLLAINEKMTKEDEELCKLLVARGADINLCKNKYTFPPLIKAIDCYQFDLALWFIQKQAKVNYRGSNDLEPHETCNALIELLETCTWAKNIEPQLRVMEALLAAKADLNQTDHNRKNVLFYVLELVSPIKTLPFLSMLLTHGANVQHKDSVGDTPISKALFYNLTETLPILLEHLKLSNPEEVIELFKLFAQYGNRFGMQKMYNLGIEPKVISEIFKNMGIITEYPVVRSMLFGNNTRYFEPDDINYAHLIKAVQWFFQYMSSPALLEHLKQRNAAMIPGQNSLQDRVLHRLIADQIMLELMKRNELEYCLTPGNASVSFDHPIYMKNLVQFTAARLECTPKAVTTLMCANHPEMRFLPYWTLATRGKSDSQSKFCKLPPRLKLEVIKFLEYTPLAVSLNTQSVDLLNKRMLQAESLIAEKEEETRKKKQLGSKK